MARWIVSFISQEWIFKGGEVIEKAYICRDV